MHGATMRMRATILIY